MGIASSSLFLLDSLEALPALKYLDDHPSASPIHGCRDLRVSFRTWYRNIAKLEERGLLSIVREGRGRRANYFCVTRRGRKLIESIETLSSLLANSRAVLELELESSRHVAPPRRVGEILCRLVEHAEARADIDALGRLQSRASALSRKGEMLLACEAECLFTYHTNSAMAFSEGSQRALADETDTRSYRKSLAFRAAVFDSIGAHREAFKVGLALRRFSRGAGDVALEAESHFILGVAKMRRSLWTDAARELDIGANSARISGRTDIEAKVTANLALVRFVNDRTAGLKIGRDALAAARDAGSRYLVARSLVGLSLMEALQGHGEPALSLMNEGRRACASTHPLWKHAMLAWGRTVRESLQLSTSSGPSSAEVSRILERVTFLIRTSPVQLGLLSGPRD